jgi:predicted  nucleic acid-binding Zn-ribbon protein
MAWLQTAMSAALAAAFIAAFMAWRWRGDAVKSGAEAEQLRSRYSSVIDVDAELRSIRDALEKAKREQQEFIATAGQNRTKLKEQYAQALATYSNLQREVSVLEENLEDISFGLYKPHFNFQAPGEYKAKLTAVRDRQRDMLRAGTACTCAQTWTVSGSEKEGARMVKQTTKVLLRAFNGECDAAVANVSWNNITRMEERVKKSLDAINQLGTVLQLSITRSYLEAKLDELHLTHEYENARYREKEEQRRIREEMREEERAQKELQKAKEEAEQEEARYQKALEKARAEAAEATGKQLEKLSSQIDGLQAKLEEAHQNKERAVSRAQLTKSGFVYIISNIGSFGERVYKIGMTRRLEPMDRIYELGDASVPFPFDLHAMMFSQNAPELESALHNHLEEKRFNLVNPRREFYYDVDLDGVERFVHERGFSAQFIKIAEAREYRESLAVREERRTSRKAPHGEDSFPADPFSGATAATPGVHLDQVGA